MKILITGASGLIGQKLQQVLKHAGHQIETLSRQVRSEPHQLHWDPERGLLDIQRLEGQDAVIHLAGESVAARLWSPAQRQRILTSRVKGTRLLVQAIRQLQRPPRVLISASAIGYYGPQPLDVSSLTEADVSGRGFLASVCRAWEAETHDLALCRVVNIRLGMVLSAQGGALKTLLPAFQWGLGGSLGNGKQSMSWIALDDVVRAICHCLLTESLTGPVNLTAPEPVSNQVFTRTLNDVLKRPGFLPLPAGVLQLLLGDLAQEMLLAHLPVHPQKLQESAFRFRYPELEIALRQLLER